MEEKASARSKKMEAIANNNKELTNDIIKYIYNNLNIDLYKEYNNNSNNTDIKKVKSFYKQTIIRLLRNLERKTNKKYLIWKECEEGQALLDMKKAATVQSPSYENEFSKNTGLIENTYEKKLLSIEEEIKKQQKRLIVYQVYCDQIEQDKKLLEKFIDLIPNATATVVVTRHFILGEKYCDIARDLNYSEVYLLVKRGVDDLAQILMYSL